MARMRRQWFWILLSLAGNDRHGSGIMRDVLELTDGELRLWPVTLYGSLDELCDEGFIRPVDPPSDADDGGHKRWFRLAAPGKRALAAEVSRMEGVVGTAHQRLAPGA